MSGTQSLCTEWVWAAPQAQGMRGSLQDPQCPQCQVPPDLSVPKGQLQKGPKFCSSYAADAGLWHRWRCAGLEGEKILQHQGLQQGEAGEGPCCHPGVWGQPCVCPLCHRQLWAVPRGLCQHQRGLEGLWGQPTHGAVPKERGAGQECVTRAVPVPVPEPQFPSDPATIPSEGSLTSGSFTPISAFTPGTNLLRPAGKQRGLRNQQKRWD